MGEAAAIVSAVCWAGTSVALARLSTRYGGAVLSGLRFLSATPFLLVLLVATGGTADLIAAGAPAILAVVASACFNYGIGDTLYVRSMPRIGLQRMSATTTALWVSMSGLGAVLLLDEPAGWDLLVGGVAVIIGVYLVVSGQVAKAPDPAGPSRLGPLATVLVLLGIAASWTASTLILAGARGDLGAIAASAIRVPAGGIIIATAAMIGPRGEVLRRLPSRADMPLVAAVGILGTAFGGLCYIYAVTEAGAARTVILNSTSPLMVVPLAMVFLGERPTMRIAVGIVFSLVGTLIVVAAG